jgi:autotransporter-associated beta strand protein
MSADQTWNIANASTAGAPFTGANRQLNNNEDFAINGGNTTGAGILFDLGGHTVTTTGAGTISISSGYTISNGTFNIGNFRFEIQGGASKLTNVTNTVVFNVAAGSILHYQSNSGAFSSEATVNLNGGTLQFTSNNATNAVTQSGTVNVNQPSTILVANNVGGGGNSSPLVLSGNLVGSAALAINATATNVNAILRLTGDNSAYTGTITFGGTAGRSTRLGSFNAGSTAATWNVSSGHTLQIDGVTVELGTLAGAGTVTSFNAATPATIDVGAGNFAGSITDGTTQMMLNKVSNGTLTLSGTNTYTGATTVLGGTMFATPGGLGATAVTVADGAAFGVKLVTAGTTLMVPSVSTGTITGAQLAFDLGTLGNPTIQAMNAGALTVNAPTGLRVMGTGFTVGTFPLLGYTGTIGGLSFGGLSLVLPPRILGSLVNDSGNSRVNVTITAANPDTPKWTGAIDGKWDIDNGTGTGTANWREVNGGNVTRYIQHAGGSDNVRFDDTATGTTTIQLTADLAPNDTVVDNTAKDYVFTGAGRITGAHGLTKSGTGALRIRNAGNNDYSGGTIINAGTVELGDGITVGAGTLGTGPITNNGLLVFNRPDAFTIAGMISGTGRLSSTGNGITTLSGAVTQPGPVTLTAGGLVFGGGGNLSGAITGAGSIANSAGTMELSGVDPNSYTGGTTVSGGVLRLNKSPGVSAVGGNVTIAGGGVLTIVTNEQIPDTATINVTGTSADSTAGTTGMETVANVIMNASVPTGQFIMRNNFTITGQATVQNGILGVASLHTANVNSIVMSGGIVRIAGSGGASTLNVGAGGITASAGEIQVKFNINDQDAVLNLGGDFTTTGNVAVTNAGYTGFSLNQVNLTGTRTFNIGAGTTTTIAPDVSGVGGLTKTGNGTLDLRGRNLNYTGDTTVSAGTLIVPTSSTFATSSIAVADNATLRVRISPGTFIPMAALTLGSAAGGKITFDLGTFGNPTIAPLSTTNFSVSAGSKLVIVGATTNGTFPLIDYSGTIGGAGFAGLSLELPLRVGGTLVNNIGNTSVDLSILGTDTPKWNGNISTNWDIDDGTGTGTANWRGFFTNTATRYLQGAGGTDQVIFDDSATGSGTISLTTTLSPVSTTVTNTTKTYTFSGPGKLAGTGSLTKEGTGTLILANSVPYENTGGTFVSAGTLQVGDGVTPGVGILPNGATTNNSTLTLNRPDDFDLISTIVGSGTLVKAGTNTASVTAAMNYAAPVVINGGTMRFTAGGNLSGVVSGAGALVVDGGTLQLSGFEANTLSGETTVNSGTLQLNKTGVNAIVGTLTLANNGALTLSQPEQIADNATLIFNKTAGNQVIGNETIGAFNIIGGSETAQLQANNGFVVTGIGTMSTGVFSVASNHSATVSGLNISGGTLRIAANSNPSTLNVGANGINASGGLIQVGQGTGAFDAVLNLDGNFIATGNVNVTDGNFGGTQKREINIGGVARTFAVADLATLSIAPDIAGAGGLIKDGPGTLVLTAASASTYTGITSVTGGVMEIVGSITGTTKVEVSGTGRLSGSGSINPAAAGNVNILAGGKLSPGPFMATLTMNFTGGGELNLSLGVDPANSQALVFDLDLPFLSDKVVVNGGAVRIGTGVLDFGDFAFSTQAGFDPASAYTLIDGTSPIIGTLGAAIDGVINGQIFELQFADAGNDLVLVPVPEPGSALSVLVGLALMGRRRRRNQHSTTR